MPPEDRLLFDCTSFEGTRSAGAGRGMCTWSGETAQRTVTTSRIS